MEEKGLGLEPTGCRDPQGRALEYLGFQPQCVWQPGVCPVIWFLSFDLQLRVLEKTTCERLRGPRQGW